MPNSKTFVVQCLQACIALQVLVRLKSVTMQKMLCSCLSWWRVLLFCMFCCSRIMFQREHLAIMAAPQPAPQLETFWCQLYCLTATSQVTLFRLGHGVRAEYLWVSGGEVRVGIPVGEE